MMFLLVCLFLQGNLVLLERAPQKWLILPCSVHLLPCSWAGCVLGVEYSLSFPSVAREDQMFQFLPR